MPAIQVLSRPEFQRLSLALLHFVWQGVAIAFVTAAIVFALRLRRGRGRYAVYLMGFGAMFLAPVATYWNIRPAIDLDRGSHVAHARLVDRPTNAQPAAARPSAKSIAPMEPTRAALSWQDRGAEWVAIALPWVPGIWAIGVAALCLRLLTGAMGVRRWKKQLSDLPPPMLARVDQLAARLGLPGFRRVFASARIAQPSAVGIWRPMIILPLAMVAQMPPEMMDAIIAHELAHLRRLDPLVNVLQLVVETLLFYHPAVWWLSGRIRREREICCDELAAGITERMTYVAALERAVSFTLGVCGSASGERVSLAFGGGRRQMLERIKHLLDMPAPRAGIAWPAGLLALALLMAGIGVSKSAAQKMKAPLEAIRSESGAATQPRSKAGGVVAMERSAVATEGSDVLESDRLLSAKQDAKEQAREQVLRNQERAELDVEEAKLGLEAKKKDRDLVAKLNKEGAVQVEFDHAQLAVDLGQIQLKRARLQLEDAKAKTQTLTPSSVTVHVTSAEHINGLDTFDEFSVRTRTITLKQSLAEEKHFLDLNEKRGDGFVSVMEVKEGKVTRKSLDRVPLRDVLSGKVEDRPLHAGEWVEVAFDNQLPKEVGMLAPNATPTSASWRELPERNMTLTQVLAATKYDLKAIADQKVTLTRKVGGVKTKVIDGVPIRDLVEGKVKDLMIESFDHIDLSK